MNKTKLTLTALAIALAAATGCKKHKDECPQAPQPVQPAPVCLSERLELYENLESHFGTMNGSNLPALLRGSFVSTPLGGSSYEQHLTPHTVVDFAQDEFGVVDTYHFGQDGQPVFTYDLHFPAGLKAVRAPDFSVPDFIGVQVNILGTEYKISAAAHYNDGTLKMSFDSLDGLTHLVLQDKLGDGFSTQGSVGANVNGTMVNDAEVAFSGEFINGIVDLRKISYRLNFNGFGDMFCPKGLGVRSQLTTPEGMLSPNWDIKFDGMTQPLESQILLYPFVNGYSINFTNREGLLNITQLLENVNGQVVYSRNNGLNKFHFVEDVPIKTGDRFIVNKPGNDLTHMFEFDKIDTQNKQVTFIDIVTGNRDIVYGGSNNEGTLVTGGVSYNFFVDEQNKTLKLDLNGNGIISNFDFAYIVDQNGAKIRLGESDDPNGSRTIKVTTLADKIDSSKCTGLGEDVVLFFNAVGSNVEGFIPLQESGNKVYDSMLNAWRLMSKYGVHATQSPSGVSPSYTLDIKYPEVQKVAQVRFEP